MSAQPRMVAETEATGPFVINLCSSTTPMALSQPQTPELKRFNFFLSRRRADGRDRFHLHMGHFMTLAEAEEWVNVVRDIYPAAWAGEAPGRKLAERAAAAAAPALQAAPVVVPPVSVAAEAAPPVVAPPVAAPVKQVPKEAAPVIELSLVETVEAPVAVAPVPVAQAVPVVVPTLKAAPPPPRPAPPKAADAVAKPAPVAAPVKPKAVAPAPRKPVAPASNVKEVLKALDDTGHTRLMPSPVTAPPAAQQAPVLSDTGVLKILEGRRAPGQSRASEEVANGIELLRPDDTATVRALKEAVQENAAVSFAVQLQWSVKPIDLASVPPLAIFSAYTLYTVDGSRDGRKWFGLRLGFFGDAISAKQVASYVRSEFASVAVIPVSAQERGRATEGDPKAATAKAKSAEARKQAERPAEEFKLIDVDAEEALPPGLAAAQAQMKSRPAQGKAKPVVVKAVARKKALGRVRATDKRPEKSLEETLEILGASELEIDRGRGEFLNDSGVRHLRVEIKKDSPFTKLLDRLSERVRKT